MLSELNVETGDTLVITLGERMSGSDVNRVSNAFASILTDQQVNVVFLPPDTKLDLVKSSNLGDTYDDKLRAENPALQTAWEQYQVIKNLMDKS